MDPRADREVPGLIFVSDASPLRYAAEAGFADIVVDFCRRLAIPPAVLRKLTHPSTPAAVRAWITGHEGIQVTPVDRQNDPFLAHLDAGEHQAILLAEQLAPATLIIDERLGRMAAFSRRIVVTGLLGIVRDAALERRLDFESTLARLKATDFRVSAAVEDEVRRQFNRSR